MDSYRTELEVSAEPAAAFDQVVEELAAALQQRGLRFDTTSRNIVVGSGEVARITSWQPGQRIGLEWRPVPGTAETGARVELRFQPNGAGTLITMELHDWADSARAYGDELSWFASQISAPLFAALEPGRLGDWITDRVARRPAGRQSRATYRDPLYHYPNFRVILSELALGPTDYLLEVGCGGGALLHQALETGCRAAAIDHSPDMIDVARTANRAAMNEGRLSIARATAEDLPFKAGTFTCAAMTGVLGFLPDAVRALSEIRRTLRRNGRVVLLGSDPELRGTPASPEPIASRLRFYDDSQLEGLGRQAGFEEVTVIQRDLEQHARAAGVPEEHIPLFAGVTRFLLARKH